MPETQSQIPSAASETSLMAVYIRAMESQRPDALIKDEKAVALVAQMSDELARFEQIPMSDALKVMRNLATREYDRQARDFLARHTDAVVVHIGCGLDSRFERVDNGQVEWYDLDLPEVIELRRKLFGEMNGDSLTRLSRGWPTFDGCALSRPRSGRRASTTSNLERQQGEGQTGSHCHDTGNHQKSIAQYGNPADVLQPPLILVLNAIRHG